VEPSLLAGGLGCGARPLVGGHLGCTKFVEILG